ncbi:341_t:CDS:2 [Cetraspora pellucida]|uniref:341_t:CDS:1 n=1 Tax=Cetraspora pellucida TaxID=1433469 RepID=A0ACA9M2A6_9GLOM|nr:341_t:CDS:2 [Cetraspora pellucida]
MDSYNEYTSDVDYAFNNNIQDDIESSASTSRKKAVEDPVAEPGTKKICVNFSKSNKVSKKAYVWKYFEEDGENDICKIVVLKNNEETDCNKSYKHDGRTGNMKSHLQIVHGILGPEELKSSSGEKHQLSISEMIKKDIEK